MEQQSALSCSLKGFRESGLHRFGLRLLGTADLRIRRFESKIIKVDDRICTARLVGGNFRAKCTVHLITLFGAV